MVSFRVGKKGPIEDDKPLPSPTPSTRKFFFAKTSLKPTSKENAIDEEDVFDNLETPYGKPHYSRDATPATMDSPESPEDRVLNSVKVVTVRNPYPSSPSHRTHSSRTSHTRDFLDESTVVSELTSPTHQPATQTALFSRFSYAGAAAQPPGQYHLDADHNHSSDADRNNSADENQEEEPPSLVTRVLGMVDMSCLVPTPDPPAAEVLRKPLRFNPEWGVPPPEEDDDDDEDDEGTMDDGTRGTTEAAFRSDAPGNRSPSPYQRFTPTTSDPPARRLDSPTEHLSSPCKEYENFELILDERRFEDLKLDESVDYRYNIIPSHRRSWSLPFLDLLSKKEDPVLGIAKRDDLSAEEGSTLELDYGKSLASATTTHVTFPRLSILGSALSPVPSMGDSRAQLRRRASPPVEPVIEPDFDIVRKEDETAPPKAKALLRNPAKHMLQLRRQRRQQQPSDKGRSFGRFPVGGRASIRTKSALDVVTKQSSSDNSPTSSTDLATRQPLQYYATPPASTTTAEHEESEKKSSKTSVLVLMHPAKLLLRARRAIREKQKQGELSKQHRKGLGSSTPKTSNRQEAASASSENDDYPTASDSSSDPKMAADEGVLSSGVPEVIPEEEEDEEEKKDDELVRRVSLRSLAPEVAGMPDEPPVIKRSFSWKGRMTFAGMHSSSPTPQPKNNSSSDPGASSGFRSATATLLAKSLQSAKQEKIKSTTTESSRQPMSMAPSSAGDAKKSKKAVWKAVTDSGTGRTYYYHRVTRKTTWTKPPEHELRGIPANDEETDITKIRSVKSNLSAGSGTNNEKGIQNILQKKSARDFDPDVWRKKEEIAAILATMAPPEGTSVRRLVTQYEGKEDELLDQLKDLAESRPFDEPVAAGANGHAGKKDESEDKSVNVRSRAGTSVKTGTSKISDKTEPIKNTAKGKLRVGTTIRETDSHATSISSKRDEYPSIRKVSEMPVRQPDIPENIPVPRSRELMVEEFSSERFKKETFDSRRSGSSVTRRNMRFRPSSDYPLPYATDEATESSEQSRSETGQNDSISALSEENEFNDRRAVVNLARRQALDDAIAREDWDLAAALSEGMRSKKGTPVSKQATSNSEWTQSELDRFISENDWDAVANYVARVRAKSRAAEVAANRSVQPPPEPAKGRTREFTSARRKRGPPQTRFMMRRTRSARSEQPSESSSISNPQKRFGARSQLQHDELHSVSSWDSSASSGDSDYSSASYDTSDDDHDDDYDDDDDDGGEANTRLSRRAKEFAC